MYSRFDQTKNINKKTTGSRKLVLQGNMAQNQIKALTNRVDALNGQIQSNKDYIRTLETQLFELTKENYKLKQQTIILDKTMLSNTNKKENHEILYIMQA
jgi:hypothetical protein